MNTNPLRKFAQTTRKQLHTQIAEQLQQLSTPKNNLLDSPNLVEQIAFSYFIRLIVLRFLQANQYLQINWRVENFLVACDELSESFPKIFESLDTSKKQLFPNNFALLMEAAEQAISLKNCQSVEVLGWLYQFYISERKDVVFANRGKVAKEDIPAVTQLFTPRWIVAYLVQNTLGKLWLQNRPKSRLRKRMPYFIASTILQDVDFLEVGNVEQIRFLDQACGCGHILVYAFDLFAKIYEEEGYAAQDIPKLIIEQNLYGFEIDPQATQLTIFALMMKARSYHEAALEQDIRPNILCFQDVKEAESIQGFRFLENASNFGALLHPKILEIAREDILSDTLALQISDSYSNKRKVVANQKFVEKSVMDYKSTLAMSGSLLTQKYHCIVNNPPYMGSQRMNAVLAAFIKKNYPDSKADLMAVFMEVGLSALLPKGFLGIINQQAWMFLHSYKRLRKKLLESVHFDTLLHLGTRAFPAISGEVVQSVAFTFWNKTCEEKGTYIRLLEAENSEAKRVESLNAIQNTRSAWRYEVTQKQFQDLPNQTIGYWVNKRMMKALQLPKLREYADTRLGMATADNAQFLRFFWEVKPERISFDSARADKKWFPYAKGGEFRKWYGNMQQIVNWENEGYAIRNFKNAKGKARSHNYNLEFIFKDGITWNALSSGVTCFRMLENALFDNSGSSLFVKSAGVDRRFLLGLLNSKVVRHFLPIISPTLNYQPGTMSQIPVLHSSKVDLNLVDACLEIAKEDWNSRETTWGFQRSELLRFKGSDLEITYANYQTYWREKFYLAHEYEMRLNTQFIQAYGLEKELDTAIPFEEITLLKKEAKLIKGELHFKAKEIFAQLMSYIIGCAFGRFSGQTNWSRPSTAKIILNSPVDVCHTFLKSTFGEANFEKNLSFLEVQIGKSLEKYFLQNFYKDHLKRYKKRPIYWLFSSPKGSFQALVYMHNYTSETLENLLRAYLNPFIQKLESEKTATKNSKALHDCLEYQAILREAIQQNIVLDLDDGVLVNYNRLGAVVKMVKGLNDAKTRTKFVISLS